MGRAFVSVQCLFSLLEIVVGAHTSFCIKFWGQVWFLFDPSNVTADFEMQEYILLFTLQKHRVKTKIPTLDFFNRVVSSPVKSSYFVVSFKDLPNFIPNF